MFGPSSQRQRESAGDDPPSEEGEDAARLPPIVGGSSGDSQPSPRGDLDFTIVVPANLRFRGANMTLDLKLDQIDLSKAMGEASASSASSLVPSSTAVTDFAAESSAWRSRLAAESLRVRRIAQFDESEALVDSTTNDFFVADSPSLSPADVANKYGDENVDERNGAEASPHSLRQRELRVSSSSLQSSRHHTVADPGDNQVSTSDRVDSDAMVRGYNGETREDACNQSTCKQSLRSADESSSSRAVVRDGEVSKAADLGESIGVEGRDGSICGVKNLASPTASDAPAFSAQLGVGDLSLRTLRPSESTNLAVSAENSLRRGKSRAQSSPCAFLDVRGQCKQKAILSYKYCIRHILLDPAAPYRQCAHRRKPKNTPNRLDKNSEWMLCTNAIHTSKNDIYCSTHLIMNGMLEPKRKATSQRDRTATGGDKSEHTWMSPHYEATQASNGSSALIAIPTMGEDSPTTWHTIDQRVNFSSLSDERAQQQQQQQARLIALQQQHPQLAAKLLQPPAVGASASASRLCPSPSSVNCSYAGRLSQPPQNNEIPLHNYHQFVSPQSRTHHSTLPALPQRQTPTIAHTQRHSSGPMMIVAQHSSHSMTQPSQLQLKQHSLTVQQSVPSRELKLRSVVPHPVLINSQPEAKPIKYNLAAISIDDAADGDEEGACYPQEGGDIGKQTLSNHHGKNVRRRPRAIKLRQKPSRIRLRGQFRSMQAVDEMCKILEVAKAKSILFKSHDFDSTDLFPLGLEPSDDDESDSSDDTNFMTRHSHNGASYSSSPAANRIELYLMKKQLRLESSRLVQRAKITVPVVQAAKIYKNSVGAALCCRLMNKRRQSLISAAGRSAATRKCLHTSTNDLRDPATGLILRKAARCKYVAKRMKRNEEYIHTLKLHKIDLVRNPSLPMLNSCLEHIVYNVSQRLFSYCSRRCCGKPVLITDSALYDGLCRAHFEESEVADRLLIRNGGTTTFAGVNDASQVAISSQNPMHPPPIITSQMDANASLLLNQSAYVSNYWENPLPQTRSKIPLHHQQEQQQERQDSTSSNCDHYGTCSTNGFDQLGTDIDGIEGDVSLASVAKDLGFDGRELTDMLEQSLEVGIDEASSVFLGNVMHHEDDPVLPRITTDVTAASATTVSRHSWADVDEFLQSEGYHADLSRQ